MTSRLRLLHLIVTFNACVPSTSANALPPLISVATGASQADKWAASQLRHFLQLACPKMNFTIQAPGQSAAPSIIVGPDAARALGLPVKYISGLGNESFYSAFFTPPLAGSIVLTGGLNSARGTLYAVFHMLRRVVGFRFLSHDETIAPSACPTQLSHYELTEAPAFEYRDNNQYQPSTQSDWSARVAYNGRSEDAAHGGHVRYASPPGFVHTSYQLLAYPHAASNTPPPALYAAHPSWFWPRGKAGAGAYGQLCWSNETLVAFVTAQARRVLQAQPDATILSISQNDNSLQCDDPAERAVNQREGSPIGALLLAVNAVAEALEGEFPHVAFDTLAYQWTRPAPTSGLRPRHNVIIRLCSIECDFAHPLTHPNNSPFQQDMVDWSKLSNRTYIWDYVTNFRHYVAPFPNWHVLVPNLRFFHQHGVKGVFEEGTYGTAGGDLVQLKDYVMAQALWDPTVDGDSLIAEFLTGYYAAAAPYVQAYMDAMLQGIQATSYYMHESFEVDAPFLRPVLLLRSAGAFVNASKAVARADERFQRRVQQAEMPVMYAILFRWDEVRTWAAHASFNWPYNASMRPQFDEFKRRYAAIGMSALDEAGHSIDWMEAELFPTLARDGQNLAADDLGRRVAYEVHWPVH